MKCPICKSDETRSKVHDKEGWWYVCDNWNHPHNILLNHKEISLKDNAEKREAHRMFYFNDNKIEIPGYGTLHEEKEHV